MAGSSHPFDADVGPDPPGTPLWVKLCAAFVLALILVVVVMLIFGGGTHGPVRHTPSGDAGGRTSPGGVGELGLRLPRS